MRNADNHAGWSIEMLTDEGWKVDEFGYIFNTKEAAELDMAKLKKFFVNVELRVYEVIQ